MASRTVRGVRQQMPPGSLVGRLSGSGAAQVVSLQDIASALQSTGLISAPPAAGGSAPTTVSAGTGISVSGGPAYTISLSTPVTVGRGGTGADLSATGGTGKVLKQTSAGGAVTVAAVAASEVTGLATIATSGSASDLGSGTLPSPRVSGSYTGITGVGLLSTGGANFAPAADTDLVNLEALLCNQFKNGCGRATTAALPSCTYSNGTAGVGATLTGTANGALSVDGATVNTNDTILIKNQAAGLQNGIYRVTQVGDASHPFIITRDPFYDDTTAGSFYTQEIKNCDTVPVSTGTKNANTLWMLISSGSGGGGRFVVGTDALTFQQVGGANVVTTAGSSVVLNPSSVADKDLLVYDSSSGQWLNQRQHYDISFSVPGVPAASQSMEHTFSKAVTIPANFGSYLARGSQAGGTVAATASTVFTVKAATAAAPTTFSTTVGTITFALGTVTPTFATTGGSAQTFAQGDTIQIVAPASPDATFAGFRTTLCGFET